MLILLTSLIRSLVDTVTAAQLKSVESRKSLVFFIWQGPFHLLYFKGGHVSLMMLST